jgi:hypothetical protein
MRADKAKTLIVHHCSFVYHHHTRIIGTKSENNLTFSCSEVLLKSADSGKMIFSGKTSIKLFKYEVL